MKKYILFAAMLPWAAMATDDCATRTTVPDTPQSLQQVIELGLCRNPQTAAAYLSAESARLSKNAGYSSYLPSVNASASAGRDYRNKDWGGWQYGAAL